MTFGDESAIRPDRVASVLSIVTIFLIWGAFPGSTRVPVYVPGPFVGESVFGYQALAPSDGTGVGQRVDVSGGTVVPTTKGSLNFGPSKGWRIEPIWLPAPEAVAARFVDTARNGYQDTPLRDDLAASLMRVLGRFALSAVAGIPLGYAMFLSDWVRGRFDPVVEFMRPVPPLALIRPVIIWFGIWEPGKIVLLFRAALWIMTIAARSGVSGVRLARVHAAYSLGASRAQILRHVIVPNSLPDLFTGAWVAIGVRWGTVVAAEFVAAQKDTGMMIIAAAKFQMTDVLVMGIIRIGVVGYGIDRPMRAAETRLLPWRGRG